MLIFVASCVDRSLLVGTVRDFSAYDVVIQVFLTRVLLDGKKSCQFCLIATWTGFINKVSATRAR